MVAAAVPLELKAGHGHHDGELSVASRQHNVFSNREDFPVAAEAGDLFAPVQDEGRRLGVLLHALFEDYHWSNDDPRSDVLTLPGAKCHHATRTTQPAMDTDGALHNTAVTILSSMHT